MSLAFLKNLIYPKTSAERSPLLQRQPNMDDIEQARSETSSTSSVRSNEKSSLTGSLFQKPKVNARTIADITIGLADGLTVPFALTAGLSALGDTNVVIYGGLAELIAGSISMGLGGYLGAGSEATAYQATLSETRSIVRDEPEQAVSMMRGTFADYDFPGCALNAMSTRLLARPDNMVDFLMRFHHSLAEDDYTASRSVKCGLTISAGYFLGGMIPLLPYIICDSMRTAFTASVALMALALFAFGWIKTALLDEKDRLTCFRHGMQMVVMGGLAAGAAMGCVKAIGE